jgi:hypothetical protein
MIWLELCCHPIQSNSRVKLYLYLGCSTFNL